MNLPSALAIPLTMEILAYARCSQWSTIGIGRQWIKFHLLFIPSTPYRGRRKADGTIIDYFLLKIINNNLVQNTGCIHCAMRLLILRTIARPIHAQQRPRFYSAHRPTMLSHSPYLVASVYILAETVALNRIACCMEYFVSNHLTNSSHAACRFQNGPSMFGDDLSHGACGRFTGFVSRRCDVWSMEL